MATHTLIACPACDLLHHRSRLAVAVTARCSRCGSVLFRSSNQSLDSPLALTVAAIILLVLANCFPFISLAMSGHTEQALLVSGVVSLVDAGWVLLPVLVLLTGIVFPFLQMVGVAYVLIPLRFGFCAPHLAVIYRWVRLLQPWAMTDIFMLGIFVSVAKLAGMGSIIPGVALYAFVALMFILPAIFAALNPESIWERLPLNRAV
ncbi:MAG: paraquat-inducible protein A [Desulfobacteraceae bacterium]|jgi:paraquat-inducible protein A